MNVIEISDSLFARLQSHAVPLKDTAETVIERAFDALEKTAASVVDRKGAPKHFDAASPPDLLHTTPVKISLNGKVFTKGETYWNTLMIACLKEAGKQGLSGDELFKLMIVPTIIGQKQDQGYKYYPELGLSVQGQDSNGAWRQIYAIASRQGFLVDVEFKWQDKVGAAFPAARGLFKLPSK